MFAATAAATGHTQQHAARDGVYTAAQAERGSQRYTDACAHCHQPDLLGDPRQEIPALAGDDFLVRWSNRNLGELFELIRRDMPADRPGTLEPDTCAAILAHVLNTNGFPAGHTALPADDDALTTIEIGTPR